MFEGNLPRHLRGLIAVNEARSDNSSVTGQVRCPCGCEKMKLCCFGLESNNEEDWQFGVIVIAECAECGSDHLLLDQAVHGYDGFVCHSYKSVGQEKMKPVICEKCGAEVFRAEIGIETEDVGQFIEEVVNEYPGEFSEADYVDAFGWFTMTVKCDKCGFEKELIDLELS